MAQTALGNAVLYLRGDDRYIKRTLAETQKKTDRIFSAMGDAARKAGAGLTIAGGLVTGLAAKLTSMGMDAVESENLFGVSMGGMADQARKWSSELSDAIGMNEYTIRKNMGVMNAMVSSMGLTEEAAYGVAKGMTQLSYDMASFYNLEPEEAFNKLRSGIAGETEPLKQLGILITETAVKTYALENGIGSLTGALTDQEKVQARYGLIMQQTQMAQGDMARTSDSATNRVRAMKEQLAETGTRIGMTLIPALTQVLETVGPLITRLGEWVEKNPELTGQIAIWATMMGGLAVTFGPVLMALPSMLAGIAAIKNGIMLVSGVTKGWTMLLGVKGLAGAMGGIALAGGVGYALGTLIRTLSDKYFPGFNKAVDSAMQSVWRLYQWMARLVGLGDEGSVGVNDNVAARIAERLKRLEEAKANDGFMSARAPASGGASRPGFRSDVGGGSAGGGGGVTINFNGALSVRSDEDLRRIAREIGRMQRDALLSRGVVV